MKVLLNEDLLEVVAVNQYTTNLNIQRLEMSLTTSCYVCVWFHIN